MHDYEYSGLKDWGVQTFFPFKLTNLSCLGVLKSWSWEWERIMNTECNLLAIVENGLSNFDCKTRGAIEAVIRGISWRTCIRLERDVGSDGRRRAG